MKTSIETINGKLCTVVWHMTWKGGVLPRGRNWIPAPYGYVYVMDLPEMEKHVCAVALFALPKHPKPEHARLLYRYMAEGLTPHSTPAWKHGWDLDGVALIQALSCRALQVITHCEDVDGQRVEIAITENTDA